MAVLKKREGAKNIRKMLSHEKKHLASFEKLLIDYKVRVLNEQDGTSSKVRVLIESSDGKTSWSTVGVSENIIEASWQAFSDSLNYKLLKTRDIQDSEKKPQNSESL